MSVARTLLIALALVALIPGQAVFAQPPAVKPAAAPAAEVALSSVLWTSVQIQDTTCR